MPAAANQDISYHNAPQEDVANPTAGKSTALHTGIKQCSKPVWMPLCSRGAKYPSVPEPSGVSSKVGMKETGTMAQLEI